MQGTMCPLVWALVPVTSDNAKCIIIINDIDIIYNFINIATNIIIINTKNINTIIIENNNNNVRIIISNNPNNIKINITNTTINKIITTTRAVSRPGAQGPFGPVTTARRHLAGAKHLLVQRSCT